MKKIEKLEYEHIQYESDEYGSVIDIEKIVNKINEIIDRLNQEVSQPEEVVVSGSYSTKDIHVSEEYFNKTDYQNYPEISITTSKVENNTEEWKKIESEDWKAILTRYFADTESPMKLGYGRSMKDLIAFIEQLLSEREPNHITQFKR